jgi:uncharacterized protein (DUF58 family)
VEDLIDGRPIEKRCYFLKLPAGRLQETAYRNTMAKRGRYRLSGFRLATKFPFGLVPRTRAVADADELYVYPALIPAPEALLRGLPAHLAPGRSSTPSRQGEFRGLRAYREGDDPRDIHWRSSARRGMTLVREKEDEQAREATVILDNGPEAAADEAAFERAVSEAAGLCVDLLQRGYRVGLATRGGHVPGDVGPAQARRLLRALALLGSEAGPLPSPRAAVIVRVGPTTPPALTGPEGDSRRRATLGSAQGTPPRA